MELKDIITSLKSVSVQFDSLGTALHLSMVGDEETDFDSAENELLHCIDELEKVKGD